MKISVSLVLLITVMSLIACPAQAQLPASGPSERALKTLDGGAVPVDELGAAIGQAMAKANVTGLSVAIINDGRIAYTGAFGYRDKATGAPFDTQTVTGAASFSKTVFAYLVMLLAEDGVIDLDKPLQAYLPKPLPDYPAYADLAGDDRYQQITARMVLSHSTGFPNWRQLEPDGRPKFLFAPGARYSYSGEGFALLQMVVEEITGGDLETLARTKVFEPLGMTRSSFVWQKAFGANVARPHDEFGRTQILSRRSKPDAAGSLITTAEDYARLLAAILNATGPRKATMDEMLRSQIAISSEQMFGPGAWQDTDRYQDIGLAWGLGWGRFDTELGRAFFHTGHDFGYQNYTVTYLDRGIGVVLLSNSNNFESVAREIVQAAIGDVYSPFDWLGYVPFDPSQVKTPPPEPIAVIVLALGVLLAVAAVVIAIWRSRKLHADPDFATLQAKRPEGYWMGVGMALGVVLGLPVGLLIDSAMGNAGIGLALGAGMGVAIGVAIGAALERQHKGETRPLTSHEKRARRWMTWTGIAVLALLAALVALGVVAWLLR